ncbi:hypothetical protein F5Y13DRAFT_101810, partial [Hypoxylon sp. FL1857]
AGDAALADPNVAPAQAGEDAEPGSVISTTIESSNFQLGDFSVSSVVVSELFEHFEHYYLAHAPFLQPVISPHRLVLDSPLLFWTIILITCQYHNIYNGLYNQLVVAHRDLLSPFLTRGIRSIQEIHAFLLLSLWSLPAYLPFLDPTWTYVSIAIDTCTRMNFHKPLPQDHVARGWACWLDSGDITVQNQYLTWLACFSISTQASLYQGILPPLSSSHHLRNVKKAIQQLGSVLKPEHRASLAIHECICNYSLLLEDIEDSAAHLPLIQTFESTLDNIEQTYSTQSTPELSIQLEYAKMNLYAMAVLDSPQADIQIDIQSDINKQAVLIRGLELASRIIYRVKELSLLPVDDGLSNAGKLIYYPRQYITSMFYAAIYLFRMLVDCRPLSRTHVTLALGSITETRDIFKLLPPHRTTGIVADFLDRVVEKAQAIDVSAGALTVPQLLITNRLGASLIYDILFRISSFAKRYSNIDIGTRNQGEEVVNSSRIVAPEIESEAQSTQQTLFDTSLIQQSGEAFWFSWDAFFNDVDISFDQELPL